MLFSLKKTVALLPKEYKLKIPILKCLRVFLISPALTAKLASTI